MSIIEKDQDLVLGEVIHCSTGVSRGYKEFVDFCVENPELYIDVSSLGTFKNSSAHDYSIESSAAFFVRAGDLARMIAGVAARIEAPEIALHADELASTEAAKIVLRADDMASVDARRVSIEAGASVTIEAGSGTASGADGDVLIRAGKSVTLNADEVRIHRPWLSTGQGDWITGADLQRLVGVGARLDGYDAINREIILRIEALESVVGIDSSAQ